MAVAIAGAVVVLVVPMPAGALDVLLAGQLAGAAVVLWRVATARRPDTLTALPVILLACTLARLALNVATTRAILSRADAGRLVDAFGDAVVGGDLIVGLAVFGVITVAQYIVVARGAGRVAEVAARFALDALPGRQAAIDAELAAGHLDREGARARRRALMRTSGLYGAMDGVMRFVRGDALAGLCIVFVNLLGGLAVGLRDGMSVDDALSTYSILTVGDGLLSQVPAVLTTSAAAILATRLASSSGASESVVDRRPWLGVALLFVGLAALPGLPAWPLVVVAGAMLVVWRWPRPASIERPEIPIPVVERAEVPLLIALHPGADDALAPMHRDAVIVRARARLREEYGVELPDPRWVLDPVDVTPSRYRIEIAGAPAGEGLLLADHVFVCPCIEQAGMPGSHPHHGASGRWLPRGAGLDPAEYLIAHIVAIWRRSGPAALPLQTVSERVSRLAVRQPALVGAVVPERVELPVLAVLLRALLAEDLPVRDLPGILEALAAQPVERDAGRRLDDLRLALRDRLMTRITSSRALKAIHLGTGVERALQTGAWPGVPEAIEQLDDIRAEHPRAIALVGDDLRRAARAALMARPGLPVVALGELTPAVTVRTVGLIDG